ncbi:SDR family oxidoreductase [Novosphingobium resinovorum]|uniref:SDR family oxidoreductase n=1 Tax=Novosphingobium resinovorum TaxID=158500 RepID=UPI002ED3BD94|nr:SDR family oxidoreductase [Novosphingobium resinovorum]
MNLGLEGRAALVFGGSRGIGAATARALHGEGVALSLTARSEEALEGSLAAMPGAQALAADLTKPGDAEAAVAAALARHGRIDLAVVSAGAAQGGSFTELGDEVWASALELKFMGMIRALRALVPPMRAAGHGRILVIVGNNGVQANKAMLPGSAANAACLAVIRGLAEDFAPHGIRINALNPGPTRTDRWDGLVARLSEGRDPAEVEAELLGAQPLGRIATADEMGRLAAMMLSDAADMLVGTSLTADGGAVRRI